MKYQCSHCDVTGESENDLIFSKCREHNHEILQMEGSQNSSISKTVNPTPKRTSKVKGFVADYYVESVMVDGVPHFLARHLGSPDIVIKDMLPHQGKLLRPLNANECGYYPYTFSSSEILQLVNIPITLDELLEDLLRIINRYIVAKKIDKYLILGDIVLTYSQEWISTLHYPFFVGETESGKSSVLHLARWLCYRCLYGEDIPNADIYNFLGFEEEGTGTIAEDEAQELYLNKEKMRTCKNSYTKGSIKPRMLMLSNSKEQKYYKTFCPKWFAGERLPQDKAFKERLAVVCMMEGAPQSNIKRVTDEEKKELNHIRNKLLIWKLQNIEKQSIQVDCSLHGRDQELWQDYISLFEGTKYCDEAKNVVSFYVNQRHQSIHNSLEAKIFKLLLDKLNDSLELIFTEFWDYVVTDNPLFPGIINDKSGKTFYSDDFENPITYNSLSKIMEDKFQGIKTPRKYRNEGKQHQTTVYLFKKEPILDLAKKYGAEIPINIHLCSNSNEK